MLFNKIKANNEFIFLPYDDGGVLFNSQEQSLLVLNQTGAFIWCAMFEVDTLDELVDFFATEFSISVDVARNDIEQYFLGFDSDQLFLANEDGARIFLEPLAEQIVCPKPDRQADTIYLSINHCHFKITTPSSDMIHELAQVYEQFVTLPNKGTARLIQIVQALDVYSIFVDKSCVCTGLSLTVVVPYVFGIVFETIWQSKTEQQEQGRHPYLMFHAATLADKDNKAVLFPAQSGAGKSTLAALLAAKGWSFFTDELSIVVPDTKQVFSCPLPVCVKDGAVKYLVDCYPSIEKLKQYCRLDKKNVRYLPIKNAALSFDVGATLQAIVFPQYEQSIACELVVIDKTEALLRFLECGSSGRRMKEHELASVLKMLEALPCYYLKYSDINLAKLELEAVLF